MRQGFTLVELAITIVIIGLMIGGVLLGSEMIRDAEISASISEISDYESAVTAFKDKYGDLPGDMPNATDYWGEINATFATCVATVSTTGDTCDGNGDGEIDSADSGTTYSERFHAWIHLANAGFISGVYTGVTGTASSSAYVPNVNSPEASVDKGTYSFSYQGSAGVNWWRRDNTHVIGFHGRDSTGGNVGFLTGAEAYSIDRKVDDGSPAYGSVISVTGPPDGTWNPTCATSSTADSATYNVSTSGFVCNRLYFKTSF